jgi:hypothetical protein
MVPVDFGRSVLATGDYRQICVMTVIGLFMRPKPPIWGICKGQICT